MMFLTTAIKYFWDSLHWLIESRKSRDSQKYFSHFSCKMFHKSVSGGGTGYTAVHCHWYPVSAHLMFVSARGKLSDSQMTSYDEQETGWDKQNTTGMWAISISAKNLDFTFLPLMGCSAQKCRSHVSETKYFAYNGPVIIIFLYNYRISWRGTGCFLWFIENTAIFLDLFFSGCEFCN